MLGKTEKEIIGVLDKRKRATAREVLDDLRTRDVNIAYTTASTILERMYQKKLVKREKERHRGVDRYVYVYKNIQGEYIDSLLSGLVTAFGKEGVVHLAERIEEISEEDLGRIRKKLGM